MKSFASAKELLYSLNDFLDHDYLLILPDFLALLPHLP
jgi:hypothetical protein